MVNFLVPRLHRDLHMCGIANQKLQNQAKANKYNKPGCGEGDFIGCGCGFCKFDRF